MKTQKFDGKVESAYGQVLPTAITFEGTYEAYENLEEATRANDLLSNEEMLTVINNKRKANARAKATTEALQAKGINKPTLEDEQFRLKEMIKIIVAAGKTEAQAKQIAESALGVTLAG